jgi:signal transduction histidine kinase
MVPDVDKARAPSAPTLLGDVADLHTAMLATSHSILSAQRRDELDLLSTRQALDQRNADLAQANALLQATLNATPVGVVATAPDGAVTMHNERFDRLWALTAPQIDNHGVGALFEALCARLLRPADFLAWIHEVSVAPQSAGRLHCQTLDGRHLECEALPQWADGACIGVVYNWLDVSQRVEAESLRSQTQAARLANEAKTAFMSRASHELRTPLNAVLGFSQLLQMNPAVAADGKASSHLRHILTAGEHLLALMDDLLQMSRIESGLVRLAPESLDLPAAVAEAVLLCGPAAAQRELRFDNACTGPFTVWADRTRLRQVLMNLISNAIKYNRVGGTVTLRCAPAGAGQTITIEDTGQGMSPEQLEHLFEPFNRLGAERSRVEGTGLGLVITRQLVEQMGGTIDVRSQLGQGSLFSLSLPKLAPV